MLEIVPGKIHGDLPDINDDDLESAKRELDASIQKRKDDNSKFPRGNPNGSPEDRRNFLKYQQHQERIAEEQRLREQIGRKLR